MKKSFINATLVLAMILSGNAAAFAATDTVAPVVSIGVGNGNVPSNAGPVHGSAMNGGIEVYGTVTDDDLENYHLRVVKADAPEGHTCTESEALFAAGNQGHASTTLGKDACGFAYNKSVYVSAGFTNALIAIVNAADLAAFAGEGDYWFILGARDASGNRSAEDYLADARVKVTIDLSAPVSETTVGTGDTSGASAGVALSGSRRRTVVTTVANGSDSGSSTAASVSGTGSTGNANDSIASAAGASAVATSTEEATATTSSETLVEGEANAAAVGLANLPWGYLWIVLLVLLLIALGIYLYRQRNA